MGRWRGFSKQTQGFRVRRGPSGEKQKGSGIFQAGGWRRGSMGSSEAAPATPQHRLPLSFQKSPTPMVGTQSLRPSLPSLSHSRFSRSGWADQFGEARGCLGTCPRGGRASSPSRDSRCETLSFRSRGKAGLGKHSHPGTALTHLCQQGRVLKQARATCPPGHRPGMSWDTARTLGIEEATLSSYRTGPHLATQVPPSSQGTWATGFLENWSIQTEALGFSVWPQF